MPPAGAQALRNDATARDTWLAWVVGNTDLEHPTKFVARAHTADHHGGVYLPGARVADMLGDLRAQLPSGLECHGRTSLDSPEVIEVWE